MLLTLALSVRTCCGVDDFGGGVGVDDAAIGGVRVLALALGAGDAGALMLSTSNASPSGRRMVMAALFLAGLEKALEAVAAGFG